MSTQFYDVVIQILNAASDRLWNGYHVAEKSGNVHDQQLVHDSLFILWDMAIDNQVNGNSSW